MKANREAVVQAALTVERWCAGKEGCSDCPLLSDEDYCMVAMEAPDLWNLAEQLRTRGLKDSKQNKPVEFIPYTCKDCRQYPCAKHDENPGYISRCDGFELW